MMYTKQEFKGTPGNLSVHDADQPVSNFSCTLYSDTYGAVGYWKGSKDWHDDCNWVLMKEDAKLFAASKDMLDVLQDLAVTQILPEYWQDKVQEVLKKVF